MKILKDLQLTTKTLDVSPVNGKFETDGNHVYFVAGGVRYQLDQQSALTMGISYTLNLESNGAFNTI